MQRVEENLGEERQDFIDGTVHHQKMFRLNYALMVRQSEIRKMDEAIVAEDKRLMQAQQALERRRVLLEKSLEESKRSRAEAIAIYEQEYKSKMKKKAELKRQRNEVLIIEREITKKKVIQKENERFKMFLFKTSPPDWQKAQRDSVQAARLLRRKDPLDLNEDKPGRHAGSARKVRGVCKSSPKSASAVSSGPSDKSSVQSDSLDSFGPEDELELYFSHPRQFLDQLRDKLEEQIPSLIYKSGAAERDLEEISLAMKCREKKDTNELKVQIEAVEQALAEERKMTDKLIQKTKLFSSGETGDLDNKLKALVVKVEEVYSSCISDMTVSLTTLQMMECIEFCAFTLMENVEAIPAHILKKVMKIMARKKRERENAKQLQQKKKEDEEKLKRAMRKAEAGVKKMTRKQLMERFPPITTKVKKTQKSNVKVISKEEELHAFFFT